MLRQRSSSVDIFILSNSSAKKVAVPKSNCPKELSMLKKWLLSTSFAPKKVGILKKQLLQENDSFENGAPQKNAATLKK